jgi:hypothetical protein
MQLFEQLAARPGQMPTPGTAGATTQKQTPGTAGDLALALQKQTPGSAGDPGVLRDDCSSAPLTPRTSAMGIGPEQAGR